MYRLRIQRTVSCNMCVHSRLDLLQYRQCAYRISVSQTVSCGCICDEASAYNIRVLKTVSCDRICVCAYWFSVGQTVSSGCICEIPVYRVSAIAVVCGHSFVSADWVSADWAVSSECIDIDVYWFSVETVSSGHICGFECAVYRVSAVAVSCGHNCVCMYGIRASVTVSRGHARQGADQLSADVAVSGCRSRGCAAHEVSVARIVSHCRRLFDMYRIRASEAVSCGHAFCDADWFSVSQTVSS